MWESIQNYEPAIRLSAFLGIFAAVALWEVVAPRREPAFSRLTRWPNNIGIVVFNTVVVRVLFPAAAVGMALAAGANGWGLFNAFPVPGWLAVVLSVVILDFAIYLQHVLVHAVPVLWRLHRMHHADLDFDVTTGARFHPIEIVISMGLKLMVVSAMGAPALAVLIFEVILNATAMFNHGNVRIPKSVDRMLRLIVVTPDMHRVHHSVIPKETNSNFGFNLPWWDRLFGTYTDQPQDGHEGMTIGIALFRESRDLRLDRMLIQPFRDKAGDYAINRTGSGDGGRGD
jgi:sterol desaturase/sphingolipid hydroxylase (fatty acid hydroxylase superfamily)